MTNDEAIARVLTRTNTYAESDATLTEYALYEALPDARRSFARWCRGSLDEMNRAKLTKTFTTDALSSGAVSLSSLQSLDEPPLFNTTGDGIWTEPFIEVRHSSLTYPLRYVANRVITNLPSSMPSYSVDGLAGVLTLRTAMPLGRSQLTGTLSLYGVFIPETTSIPDDLTEKFLEIFASTAMRMRMPQAQAADGGSPQ